MCAGLLIGSGLCAADAELVGVSPAAVEMGTIPGDGEVTRTVVVEARQDGVVVSRLMSTCPCLTLSTEAELPRTLARGERLSVLVALDPASYDGEFTKSTFIDVKAADGTPKLVRLIVSGTVNAGGDFGDEPPPSAIGAEEAQVTLDAAKGPAPTWYERGTTVDELKAGLVLFLSPDCDRCNWVKLLWLPRFRRAHPDAQVTMIDVATQEGIDLLLEFEKGHEKPPGEEAPVAWWQGQLVYGTRTIDRLLPAEKLTGR